VRYLGLLRGVNVGGASRVEMARLRQVLERFGMSDVRTYINSGNVIFSSGSRGRRALTDSIESAIEEEFGFRVPVLLRTVEQLHDLVAALPELDDANVRCNVAFLWPDVDREEILAELPAAPGIDEVRYVKGAVVWTVDRRNVTRSRMTKLVGTPLYRRMSMRNANTVRKLYDLLRTD